MKGDEVNSKIWDIPFFLIGTKSDLIEKKQIEVIRAKVLNTLKGMFKCAVEENFIMISNDFKNFNIKK
jgi:hypothetical protein